MGSYVSMCPCDEKKLNKVTKAQECDATDASSSAVAGLIE
jgi:hypothetical protein